MGDDVFRAESDSIKAKANQINAVEYPEFPTAPNAADGTRTVAGWAALKLGETAQNLQANITAGEKEGKRLGQTLDAAAAAFTEADRLAAEAMQNGGTSVESPVLPASDQPATVPSPDTSLSQAAYGYDSVEDNAKRLEDGDGGGSLDSYATAWDNYATTLGRQAEIFTPVNSWEGEAGEASASALRAHAEWLTQTAPKCKEIATLARALKHAHESVARAHPKASDLEELKKLIVFGDQDTRLRAQLAWAQLQKKSDELMKAYESGVQVPPVSAEKPPSVSGIPSVKRTWAGHLNDRGNGSPSPGSPGGSPEGGSPSPDGQPSNGQPTTPSTSQPSTQPASAQQSGEGSPSSGGSPSGGSPSGGSGSGGGMPGGGMPSMPDLGKDLPGMPDDPGLHPAGAGGGGSGGGAGGGGGMPKMPLQPGVGAVAVGPGPASAGASGGAAPAAAAAGGMGGMGGGMGGGHGAGGHGGGKEKKRTPGLSPDEELYTEDRAWTEGYIGKPQRKPGPAPKDRREE